MQARKNKDNIKRIALIGALSFLLYSCSVTKYIKQEDTLFVGSSIKIEKTEENKSSITQLNDELKSLTRPIPNSSFLGMYPKLFFYNLGGDPSKESKIRKWFRTKLGEPPVTVSQVDAAYTSSILANRLENKGYFNVDVSYDTVHVSSKKEGVNYTVKLGNQYKIRNVNYPNDSTPLLKYIRDAKGMSELKEGKPYNLDVIKTDRTRLDNYVKNKGYYYFSENDLLVQIDSTVGNHELDMFVKLKNTTPKLALQPYTIGNVYVNTDYVIGGKEFSKENKHLYEYNDFYVLDSLNLFKPSIFESTIYVKKGTTYNRDDHNLSLNRLVNLGVFKFVRNSFVLTDSLNHKLDAYYYLTPDKPKSIRLELLGKTNSASYSGAELNLNWSHKNIFKGAEKLSISTYGGADFQASSKGNGYSVYKVGLESSITWPRVISPWDFKTYSAFVPKTRVTLGGEYLERSKLYTLQSFKGSWGYLWKENVMKEHQFNLIDINYVSPQNVTDLYMQYAKGNPSLERVVDKQLIFGPSYVFTFTNTMKQNKKHTFYYTGGLDFSGNITGLVMGADTGKGEEKKILGVPFSQYVKTEHDIRHYLKVGKDAQLVSRFHGGIGLAYGNSYTMPYTKQFFVGGSNSLRAFRARTIGPGSFDPSTVDSKFIPDQSGDMLLEMNLEFRKKLVSIIHGAAFIDAGNIWNLREISDRPGGEFSKNFMNDLAVGAGVGLRFDITFIVLRFDFAFPLRMPYGEDGGHWVVKDIQLGDSRWRKDNLMFNFAIGYPF